MTRLNDFQSPALFCRDYRPFDNKANGIVVGEGVGIVILKLLQDAERDHDPIYGVIRGSGTNQDGQTSGITVPSFLSQSRLQTSIYREAKINVEDIQYIETHGTATKLGDPVEIHALNNSFQQFTSKKRFCAIGSLKANIGHTAAAAGVMSVIKVLLSLKHKQIPPSIHFKQENEHIEFENGPVYVNTSLQKWPVNSAGSRMAAVSSFGYSGTNAHIVLEEYVTDLVPRNASNSTPESEKPYLIVLSAMNENRLNQVVKNLYRFITGSSSIILSELAYTLQTGRDALEEKVAFLAKNISELTTKLEAFGKRMKKVYQYWRGQTGPDRKGDNLLKGDEDSHELIDKWMAKGKLQKIAALWVQGFAINWNKLYGDTTPRRIRLPAYPFARERCRDVGFGGKIPAEAPAGTASSFSLHPLLHRNTSDISEQRFSSTFTGREFFLTDHVVKGQRILPGVAFLEMARAAVEQAAGSLEEYRGNGNGASPVFKLKNVVWARPITVNNHAKEVHIGLFEKENGRIGYNIYTKPENPGDSPVIHSQGLAAFNPSDKPDTLNIPGLREKADRNQISSGQCYDAFTSMGVHYGDGHRGIEVIHVGQEQVLAKLVLPSCVAGTREQFVLHPSLMDSALQAAIGLVMDPADSRTQKKPSLPFALEQLEIFGKCIDSMWAWIRGSNGSRTGDKVRKLDIDLCDDAGRVCVRMKGLTSRVIADKVKSSEKIGTLMCQPAWKEKAVLDETESHEYLKHLVILCQTDRSSLETVRLEGVSLFRLQSKIKNIGRRYQDIATQAFQTVKRLMEEKPAGKILLQILVPGLGENHIFSGLSALLKTAHQENPKIMGQLIEIDMKETEEGIIAKIEENSCCPEDTRIKYRKNQRWVHVWEKVNKQPNKAAVPWKDGGVYLITGGAGGLGLIFAKDIAEKSANAVIILAGRSPFNQEKRERLEELNASDARVEYKQVDVGRKKAVNTLILNIKEEFGSLDGILHCAGIVKDNYMIKKTDREFQAVLAPKVAGTVNLDLAAQDIDLEFFVLFSSGAGAFGNLGQADYSVANAFLDAFASYRNNLTAHGGRRGKTLAINWPLWKEGGMHVDPAIEQGMSQITGATPMRTSAGLLAFYECLASEKDQVIVMEGDLSRLSESVFEPISHAPVSQNASARKIKRKPGKEPGAVNLSDKIISYLKDTICAALKMNPDQIDVDKDLVNYGLDSIMALEINNKLEKHFSDLSKTLFFEFSTIRTLAEYFTEFHEETLNNLFNEDEAPNPASGAENVMEDTVVPEEQEQSRTVPESKPVKYRRKSRRTGRTQKQSEIHGIKNEQTLDSNPDAKEINSRKISLSGLTIDEIIHHLDLEIIHPNQDKTEGVNIHENLDTNPAESSQKTNELRESFSPFHSFAPFENVVENFSFSRLVAHPQECTAEIRFLVEKQAELRKVLFYKEDFSKYRKILDIGCGIATDIMEIALANPSLVAHGLTISPEEAKLAESLIQKKGLENRVSIFCEDNSTYNYEGNYDMIFGIQVLHFVTEYSRQHILFDKLSSAIHEHGKILLAEFICNLKKPMRDKSLGVTVHTVNDWAWLLGENNLVVDEVIDVSEEIRNFLFDPKIEDNIKHLDQKSRDALKKYNKQILSLENGWVCYCLLKINKDPERRSDRERTAENLEKLKIIKSYREARREMMEVPFPAMYDSVLTRFPDSLNSEGVDMLNSPQETSK